jgi:hypothetical protein
MCKRLSLFALHNRYELRHVLCCGKQVGHCNVIFVRLSPKLLSLTNKSAAGTDYFRAGLDNLLSLEGRKF